MVRIASATGSPGQPAHLPGAAWRQSLPACVSSSTWIRPPLAHKPYFRADHFKGGGSQNAAESAVTRPCGCYASRVMRSLYSAELDAYRSTGVFNDTARGKALAAIDACKLQRPI